VACLEILSREIFFGQNERVATVGVFCRDANQAPPDYWFGSLVLEPSCRIVFHLFVCKSWPVWRYYLGKFFSGRMNESRQSVLMSRCEPGTSRLLVRIVSARTMLPNSFLGIVIMWVITMGWTC